MGIKSLHKFLKRHVPSIYNYRPIHDYSGYRVAVDVNLYLYVHKSRSRKNWHESFFQMLYTLRRCNIQLVGVYDTQAPAEKYAKQQERKDRRCNNEEKVRVLKHDLQIYQQRGIVSELLLSVMTKHGAKHNLLSDQSQYVDENVILNEIAYVQNQIIRINRNDIELSRNILESLSIPVYDAPTEAETYCAHLCFHKYVDAVLSNDTDVLVYRTSHFLTKFDITKMMVIDIQFDEVVSQLDLTPEQFIDFCILCGTDYNSNMKRIGPEKAYKLIQQFGTIEGIRDGTQHDTSVLNFVRVREIFSIPETMDVTLTFVSNDIGKMEAYRTPIKPILNMEDVQNDFSNSVQTENIDTLKLEESVEFKNDDKESRSPILRPETEDDTTGGDVWHQVGSR